MKYADLSMDDMTAVAIGTLVMEQIFTEAEAEARHNDGTGYTHGQIRRALDNAGIPHQHFNDALKFLLDEHFEGDD